jgi:hypothetical protein
MEKQLLIENEEVITTSNNNSVTLTNKRIIKRSGKDYLISMNLQNISTIEVRYKSFPLILALGVLIAGGSIGAGVASREDTAFLPAILGGILIVVYFITRYHAVTISPNGGTKIGFQTQGMEQETVLEFINKIEQAKSFINQKESAENP